MIFFKKITLALILYPLPLLLSLFSFNTARTMQPSNVSMVKAFVTKHRKEIMTGIGIASLTGSVIAINREHPWVAAFTVIGGIGLITSIAQYSKKPPVTIPLPSMNMPPFASASSAHNGSTTPTISNNNATPTTPVLNNNNHHSCVASFGGGGGDIATDNDDENARIHNISQQNNISNQLNNMSNVDSTPFEGGGGGENINDINNNTINATYNDNINPIYFMPTVKQTTQSRNTINIGQLPTHHNSSANKIDFSRSNAAYAAALNHVKLTKCNNDLQKKPSATALEKNIGIEGCISSSLNRIVNHLDASISATDKTIFEVMRDHYYLFIKYSARDSGKFIIDTDQLQSMTGINLQNSPRIDVINAYFNSAATINTAFISKLIGYNPSIGQVEFNITNKNQDIDPQDIIYALDLFRIIHNGNINNNNKNNNSTSSAHLFSCLRCKETFSSSIEWKSHKKNSGCRHYSIPVTPPTASSFTSSFGYQQTSNNSSNTTTNNNNAAIAQYPCTYCHKLFDQATIFTHGCSSTRNSHNTLPQKTSAPTSSFAYSQNTSPTPQNNHSTFYNYCSKCNSSSYSPSTPCLCFVPSLTNKKPNYVIVNRTNDNTYASPIPPSFHCSNCSRDFDSNIAITNHRKNGECNTVAPLNTLSLPSTNNNLSFGCSDCGKIFSTSTERSTHINNKECNNFISLNKLSPGPNTNNNTNNINTPSVPFSSFSSQQTFHNAFNQTPDNNANYVIVNRTNNNTGESHSVQCSDCNRWLPTDISVTEHLKNCKAFIRINKISSKKPNDGTYINDTNPLVASFHCYTCKKYFSSEVERTTHYEQNQCGIYCPINKPSLPSTNNNNSPLMILKDTITELNDTLPSSLKTNLNKNIQDAIDNNKTQDSQAICDEIIFPAIFLTCKNESRLVSNYIPSIKAIVTAIGKKPTSQTTTALSASISQLIQNMQIISTY